MKEAKRIHIIIVNLAYAPQKTSAKDLLDHYFILTGWAEGLQSAAAKVAVWQRFSTNSQLGRQGITYHFVADRYEPMLRPWQLPRSLLRHVVHRTQAAAAQGEKVLVHLNGLLFPLAAGWLRTHLPDNCPLVVQHHAERPYRGWRCVVQRWGLKSVDGFLFTNKELAQGWIDRKVLSSLNNVYPVMEASSQLTRQEKSLARQQTGLKGNPILLWTGNLYANKDPLTILGGFARLLEAWPEAQLYMAYRFGNLLAQVQATIAQAPILSRQVTLLGEIPYQDIAAYYNSADLFVQGSAKEGSGIALLDALACGVIPVVTDIPAFRTITGNGRIGALWPVGDEDSFVNALHSVLTRPLAAQAEAAAALFVAQWTFTAVGQQAIHAYQHIWQQRQAKG